MKLGVNIDHIATLRNAWRISYPNLLKAAKIAIEAGEDFITVHLREDRKHIKDGDVFNLKKTLKLSSILKLQPQKKCSK